MSKVFYEIQRETGWSINYGVDSRKKLNVIGESSREHLESYNDFRAVHLIRDPRDVIVSGYHSHLTSHPTDKRPDIAEHRKELKAVDLNEGLLKEMDFSKEWLLDMAKWDYQNPNVLELRFEQFTPAPNWDEVFGFLGISGNVSVSLYLIKRTINKLSNRGLCPFRFDDLQIPSGVRNDIIERTSFSKLSGGRKVGEANENSHYRKGKSGEWKEVFSDKHKEYFKQKFPGILETLGYEQDSNW